MVLRWIALLAAALAPVVGQAQLFRAYVASDGNDANPCTLPQPCRLLPAALSAVADGGEIWMLDSANYNVTQVNIVKSVSILAVPGAVGSVIATGGGSAINIAGSAITKVILRNLAVVQLNSSTDGISFTSGWALDVADCRITGVQRNGIWAVAENSVLTVTNCEIRNVGDTGVYVAAGSILAAVDRTEISGSGSSGVTVSSSGQLVVTNSRLIGSPFTTQGAFIIANGGSPRLDIENSVIAGNGGCGVTAMTNVVGEVVRVVAGHNKVTNNAEAGFCAFQAAASSTTMVLSGNVVSGGAWGVKMEGVVSPTVYSRGDNTLSFNSSGDVSGGVLTPLSGQ